MKKLTTIFALAVVLATLNSHADIEIVDGNKMLESVNQQIININTAELDNILNEDPNVVLIDVRIFLCMKAPPPVAKMHGFSCKK